MKLTLSLVLIAGVALSPAAKTGFDSQNDLLFEIKGSAGSFVLWGADRWNIFWDTSGRGARTEEVIAVVPGQDRNSNAASDP